jgi:serine/threonine-protein kinase RsbW
LKPLQRASLQVKTDLNALTDVLAWFDQFNRPPIAYQTWLQCQLALAEGFTNAVRHAHCGLSAELPIDLEVQMLSEQIEIRIWDCGGPFDMVARISELPDTLNTDAEGGRGLKLMQRVAHSLTYIRNSDSRNCLTIIKRYDDASACQ